VKSEDAIPDEESEAELEGRAGGYGPMKVGAGLKVKLEDAMAGASRRSSPKARLEG
jgi:hypothetical protein